MNAMPWMAILLSLSVMGCGQEPSSESIARTQAKKAEHCRDRICEGDVLPKRDLKTEVALKLNNQFFIGPIDYFANGMTSSGFYWPSKLPFSKSPPELIESGPGQISNFPEVAIEIFLRSTNIPPEPHGYKLIELAEQNDWVLSKEEIRPGFLRVHMKHVIGPHEHRINHVAYYIAVELKGTDGLPPVAGCNHAHPVNSAGSGFIWRDSIWAGIRMNQKHCQDWPEIYQETMRVLSLLRKG